MSKTPKKPLPPKKRKEKLRTLSDLKELLNDLTPEELNQNIIFGLVDDTLEDSWLIRGVHQLTEDELIQENPDDLPIFILPGKLIFHP